MRWPKPWWGIALAAALWSAGAAAQSSGVCLQLEARLAEIEAGVAAPQSGPDQARLFDASIADQRDEIDRAGAEARRAGCTGGFLIFQRKAEAKCPLLMSTINRMQANLRRLMQQRSQFAGDPFSLARERNDVLRQLAMSGCRAGVAGGFGTQQPRGLLASFFGGPGLAPFGQDSFYSGSSGADLGTYRTLCVRTCDGFYFPISFSTVPAKFETDAFTCQQMCPDAEAILFTHRNPGEDPSQMVSLSGQPYTALPTAFHFRQAYDKACTCGAASARLAPVLPGFEAAVPMAPMVADSPAAFVPEGSAVPLPHLRPAAPGEDPETIANRRGALVPGVQQPPAENEDSVAVAADGRRIRIVGPAFYYAQ